jgi:ribose 5-phosphate isomerase B
MKISVGADERTQTVDVVLEELAKAGHEVTYTGPQTGEAQPAPENTWPAVARRVAEEIASGRADEGVLFCWTGTGVSMAANKVRGIRAALCADAQTARGARLWNNANVLCMSLRTTTPALAKEILEAWLGTAYQPNPTDDACLRMIDELDRKRGEGRTTRD